MSQIQQHDLHLPLPPHLVHHLLRDGDDLGAIAADAVAEQAALVQRERGVLDAQVRRTCKVGERAVHHDMARRAPVWVRRRLDRAH